VADRPRTRLCATAIGWLLVQKLARRARRVRSPNLLRCRHRSGVYGAIRSYLVSHTSQAAGKSANLLLRPRMDCALFSDDDFCLERLARGRRLDGRLTGDYCLSYPVGIECCVVSHLLRITLPGMGLARNHPVVGCNSCQRHYVLANLNILRRPSSPVPGMGYLCNIFECRNLALESSGLGVSGNYLCNPR